MIPAPYLAAGALALAVSCSICGFFFGRSYEAGEQAKEQLEQALAYADEIVRKQGIVEKQEADIEKLRAEKQTNDRIITKEVVRYETIVKPDNRCSLDGAWRVLHDAAATGSAPAESAGLASGTAERVADATALETVAANYEACRDSIDKVKGWQRWYHENVAPGGNPRTGD